MNKSFKTEQETFWAGEFGNEYIKRNDNEQIIAGNVSLFSKILKNTKNVKTVIEFGSNIGLNLRAIKTLLPDVELSGIEINDKSAKILSEYVNHVYNQSILKFKSDYKRDFVLIKGVLIHINPNELQNVYESLYKTSSKYICIAEYYNPVPVALPYRGHDNKLFKRDFSGEMLDKFKDLQLVDYGFVYHRDNYYSEYDDINWFLLEKY
jgi:spore coat polysaccharide biosynthesis protein SpsF